MLHATMISCWTPLLITLIASASRTANANPSAPSSQPGMVPETQPALSAEPLGETELNALLDRLKQEQDALRTLLVEFSQEKHLSLFADVVRAEGFCLFRRPETVRFEFTAPYRSVLVAQGIQVAHFEHAGNQWERIRVNNPDVVRLVIGQISSWICGQFRNGSDIYSIAAFRDKDVLVRLTPRLQDLRRYITAVEVRFEIADKARVTSVTIREPNGDFTILLFKRERRNISLADELFDTTGPKPTPLPAAWVVSTQPTPESTGPKE